MIQTSGVHGPTLNRGRQSEITDERGQLMPPATEPHIRRRSRVASGSSSKQVLADELAIPEPEHREQPVTDRDERDRE
jgi:hypothetical protein